MSDLSDFVTIAVSIQRFLEAPNPATKQMFYVAHVRGESNDIEANFSFGTGNLSGELAQRHLDLHWHGFTVVEPPLDWLYAYYHLPGDWRAMVTKLALARIALIVEAKKGTPSVSGYDEALANEVLLLINSAFPNPVQLLDLKRNLVIEPDDKSLSTALNGLKLEGLVEGRQHTRRNGELVPLSYILITAKGRDLLAGRLHNANAKSSVYINYGQAGAIGDNSHGVLNYNDRWAALKKDKDIDLEVLAVELETLRTGLQKTASSRDDHRELGILADAEEHAEKKDGNKVIEVLSKSGKKVLSAAKEMGTEVAARVISAALGIE